jgi:hypothetical protein
VVTRSGRDPADRLLAGAVALLPAGRREWGQAMRAELAGIEAGGERGRFALGCVRVVATQPAVLRGAGYPLLMAGVVVAVLGWTSTISYAPLRWGLVAAVLVLMTVSWLGRRPGVFGPVGDGWAARLVRAGGYLLVGAMAVGFVVSVRSNGNPAEQAHYAMPIFTVVLTVYLLGFLAVTARPCVATRRVLTSAVGAGGAATALWVVAALAVPPIPASIGLALALTAAAMVGAASANAGHHGRTEHGLLAGLCAGTTTALLIVTVVIAMSSYGPPSLIPDLAAAALTPADDLAQSRNEVVDPYIALLFLGSLLASALTVASIATRQPKTAAFDQAAAAAP